MPNIYIHATNHNEFCIILKYFNLVIAFTIYIIFSILGISHQNKTNCT